jgi:hypothetical protein
MLLPGPNGYFRGKGGCGNFDRRGTVPIGNTGITIPASTLPYYSVRAIGRQSTYILP